jgi:hypothetical protein
MVNPIAFTVPLRRTFSKSGHLISILNETEVNRIYNLLGYSFLRAIFPRHLRKSPMRPHFMIGNIEYGANGDNPHIHLVVDFGRIGSFPIINQIIRKSIKDVRKRTRLISTQIDICHRRIDGGWVRYFCKEGTHNLLFA